MSKNGKTLNEVYKAVFYSKGQEIIDSPLHNITLSLYPN